MNETVTLAHGAGGKQTAELIDKVFKEHFANPDLTSDDAAVLPVEAGKLAFTTDGFIVSPAEFPGGNIGKLSICGTVNDLACMGAKPLYLSCAFVIEEGFPMEKLEKIAAAMEATAKEAGVKIVAGDTKVAGKGQVDGVFITTTGIGLVQEDVDWSKVVMFHLDEYAGLPEAHPASFRKYLKERFISLVPLGAYHLVDGDPASIPDLTNELRKAPIDVGLIGIGENAHIDFNDPPANFETKEAYITVNLNESCKRQQVGEGWFASVEDVPAQAISMTVFQIMQCRHIVSSVPHKVKAKAVYDTLCSSQAVPEIPATILKTHSSFDLFLDKDSSSLITGPVVWSL